ncbi:MAG: hypothetical protein RL365_1706 [Bacteroidota bacterium]|jgi:hypothetical protein
MASGLKSLHFGIILLFISCTSGIKKHVEKNESSQRVSDELNRVKPTDLINPNPDEIRKISGETKYPHLKDIRTYYHLTYKHLVGYDTITDHLQICKNIFTFFIDNPNYKELEQFRAAGFPMEFWSTNMCSFFGVPETQVNLCLDKAAHLGYTAVGYDAQLMNEQDTSSLIISNHLEIYLNRSTAHTDIHQVMNDIDGIILEGGSLDDAFIIKVETNRIKEIIRSFKKLQQHPLVRHIEFIPESCYPRI